MSFTPETQESKDPSVMERNAFDINSESQLHALPSLEVEFPEGGWKAWSVVFGVWCHQFATLGYANAFGVYNDFYIREYLTHYSSSQISWIGSVQLFLIVSVGLFTGRAFDTGYFYHFMIAGSILFSICLFMLSLTRPEQYFEVLLAQGFGLGIASGMTYVPGLAVLSHYFRRRRALAMGIASFGSGVGATIHPIMLNSLFHGRAGFHTGVKASAGLNTGLLVIALSLMRTRLPPSPPKEGSTLRSLKNFLREPAYVATIFGTFFILAGLYFPIYFVQLQAITNGLTPNFAFYTLVILNGANAIGRVVPNLLVPRLGVYNIVIFCMTSVGILVFFMPLLQDIPSTVVFIILYGFFSGTWAGLILPLIASLASNDAEIGARVGICFAFTGIGGLIGPPIAGALLSSSLIWWRPLVLSGICQIVGSSFLMFTRSVVSGKKGTPWV